MSGSLFSALEPCARLLAEWGQPAAVIGGVAFVVRIRARLTEDLDLALGVPQGSEQKFLELCRRHHFVFEPADGLLFIEGGLLRASTTSGVVVDFMVADDALYAQVVARATPVDFGGVLLPAATIEDLLLMKLEANRLLDLDDAIAIKDAFGPQLDRAYLASSGDRFGLRRQLESLLGPL